MAKMNLSSIYTQGKRYSVLNLLKQLILRLDSIEYVDEKEMDEVKHSVTDNAEAIETNRNNFKTFVLNFEDYEVIVKKIDAEQDAKIAALETESTTNAKNIKTLQTNAKQMAVSIDDLATRSEEQDGLTQYYTRLEDYNFNGLVCDHFMSDHSDWDNTTFSGRASLSYAQDNIDGSRRYKLEVISDTKLTINPLSIKFALSQVGTKWYFPRVYPHRILDLVSKGSLYNPNTKVVKWLFTPIIDNSSTAATWNGNGALAPTLISQDSEGTGMTAMGVELDTYNKDKTITMLGFSLCVEFIN